MTGGRFREFISVLGYAVFVGALVMVVLRYFSGWPRFGALAVIGALGILFWNILRRRFGRT